MEENKVVKYNKVEGWLQLLCIYITVVYPAGTVFLLVPGRIRQMVICDENSLRLYLIIETLLAVLVTTLWIIAGNKLWTIGKGAVRLAKIALLARLFYALVSIALPYIIKIPESEIEARSKDLIHDAIFTLVIVAVCFAYLCVSKRVKATYDHVQNAEQTNFL